MRCKGDKVRGGRGARDTVQGGYSARGTRCEGDTVQGGYGARGTRREGDVVREMRCEGEREKACRRQGGRIDEVQRGQGERRGEGRQGARETSHDRDEAQGR